jgi:hypothetical protein
MFMIVNGIGFEIIVNRNNSGINGIVKTKILTETYNLIQIEIISMFD